MSQATKGSSAVMAQKRKKLSEGEPWEKLELFPTPPWATRALPEIVLPEMGVPSRGLNGLGAVWEPAAGLGHLAQTLRDYGQSVWASDVFIYRLADNRDMSAFGVSRVDFLGGKQPAYPIDWIITNPPFSAAQDFLIRAMAIATRGIALLLRMQWLETEGRYTTVFLDRPAAMVAQFVERVPMCEGGWDPKLSTATAYAWFVWLKQDGGWYPKQQLGRAGHLDFFLIPPGQRTKLTRAEDQQLAARFVPGWTPPSSKTSKEQMSLGDAA